MRKHCQNALQGVELFDHLSRRQLDDVRGLVTVVPIRAGRRLIQQGGDGREFFLVISGEALVTRDDDLVATRGPGSFFGEGALLGAQPRAASVIAYTDMVVGVVDQREFRSLLDQHPELHAPLLAATADRLGGIDEDAEELQPA